MAVAQEQAPVSNPKSDKERLERLASLPLPERLVLAMRKIQEDPRQLEYLIRGFLLGKLGYFESAGYPRVARGTTINNRGRFTLGRGVKLEGCRIAVPEGGRLEIGEFAAIGSETKINVGNEIKIGPRTLVAWNVDILGQSFHRIIYSDGRISELAKPVSIGSDVWVQTGSIILPGAIIGDGSIVAAGAVLPGKEYPSKSMIAGNPAKIIAENVSWIR